MVHGRYKKEKKQMQNCMMCYNRNMDKMGLSRGPEDGLTSQVEGLAKTPTVESPIWEFIVCIGNSELSHGAQRCGDVVWDEVRKIGY